jgi:hypothetical protein
MRMESSTTSLQYSAAVLGHARLDVGLAARRLAAGGQHHHLMGGGHLGGHVRQLEGNRLVLTDDLSERPPLSRIGQRQLEGAVGDPAAARRHVHPTHLNAVHHLVEPLAGAHPEHPVRGDAAAVE